MLNRIAILALGALGLALAPSLLWNAGQAGRLFEGLPTEEFHAPLAHHRG